MSQQQQTKPQKSGFNEWAESVLNNPNRERAKMRTAEYLQMLERDSKFSR
jgi:hypothetical protein